MRFIANMLISSNYKFQQHYISFSAHSPKVTKEQLESLIKQGLNVSVICDRLKINSWYYYSLLEKFDIQTERKKVVNKLSSITKEQIKDLINSGKKYDEIPKILGISSSAYNGLTAKFGIVSDYQTKKANIAGITKEMLQTLVDSGKNVKTICEELNIPQRTYSRLLDKFGILTARKLAKAHVSSITREQFLSLIEQGLSKEEICKRLKILNHMFYILLKRLDIPYEYLHHANEKNISKERLEKLFQSEKTTSEIAQELGISVSTLHNKAKAMKVKTEFRDSIDKIASIPIEDFQSCLNSGMTIKNICEKFNISEATYSSVIRRYNLVTKQRESSAIISNVTKKKIYELLQKGISPAEICVELKISQSTYYRIINKA